MRKVMSPNVTSIRSNIVVNTMISRCLQKITGVCMPVVAKPLPGDMPLLFRPRHAQHFVERCDILSGSATSLILAKHDVAQFDEIRAQRSIVVGPGWLITELGLKTPFAAEFRHADLAFAPVFILFRPYVLTAHRPASLH